MQDISAASALAAVRYLEKPPLIPIFHCKFAEKNEERLALNRGR